VLVIEGKLSIEEAQVSPLRTILVNAIGVSADVGVEMAHLQLRPGDRLLLCSDGLHDYFVVEQEIADKLSGTDPNGALGEMVEMAKERGGHDNITGVIVNVLEVAAGSEAVPAEIEHDETMPVDVTRDTGQTSATNEWSDDEETQNLSPKDIADKADAAAASAGAASGTKRDLETDVTMEAPAVSPNDEPVGAAGGEPPDAPPGDFKRTTPMRVVRHITNPAAATEAKVEPDPPVDAKPEPATPEAQLHPGDADKPEPDSDAKPDGDKT
jgi:hypothetical protein